MMKMKMMTLPKTAFVAVLLGLAACSPQAAQQTAPAPTLAVTGLHSISGLAVIPLTVAIGGKSHQFRVEMAITDQEQATGLMFRREMGQDEGMLFPEGTARPVSFWMKNTVIPLDIIFIGPDHRVLNVAADAVPYSLEPINSAGPAIAVLELNGGRARTVGIVPGSLVTW